MKRTHLLPLLIFALVAVLDGGLVLGNPLQKASPEDPLTPPRGDGTFLFSISGTDSRDFFDPSGTRKNSSDPTFLGGTREEYVDFVFMISAAYGLTDDLAFWLDFPLLYREERLAYHADKFGLGDVRAGAEYRFFGRPQSAWEASFGLSGRFPSGDTDIGFSDSSQGNSLKLPLGTGNLDLSPLLSLKWHAADAFSWDLNLGYAVRFSAEVEYLQSPTILQASADQTKTAQLPVGNLNIDWGDEFTLGSRWAYRFAPWNFLALRMDYLYRRPTRVRNYIFTINGSTLNSAADNNYLPSAMWLTLTPSWTVDLSREISLHAALTIPIWGRNYPTLPLVESLVGFTGEMGILYAF